MRKAIVKARLTTDEMAPYSGPFRNGAETTARRCLPIFFFIS